MDYSALYKTLGKSALRALCDVIPLGFPDDRKHGDLPGWLQVIQSLPEIEPLSYELRDSVRIGEPSQMDDIQRQELKRLLLGLQPWRKGPYELFGLNIDTEWKSDWKWDRIVGHISSLQGRKVLDVGCGNGYHCWRMYGAGAAMVIGVDPHLLFTLQYWALRHFLHEPQVHVLPLALEQVPARMNAFDTVFSMGVLYHRKSPFEHLLALRDSLRKGGELVLETIIIDGPEGMTLLPQSRYARMPNVWLLPTCPTLETWLEKCGFSDIHLIDVSTTSIEEQRSTEWMSFESLASALQDNNPECTIEGYPAPKRAIFVATKA